MRSPAAMMASKCWRGWRGRTSSSSRSTTSGTGTATITSSPTSCAAASCAKDLRARRAAPTGLRLVRGQWAPSRGCRARALCPRPRPRCAADRGRGRRSSGARRGHHRAALAGGIAYRSQAPEPRLFVEHAVALVITGRPDDAEPLLKEAERAAEADGENGRFLLGFASAVRSWRARLRGDAPEAVELARRGLSLLPDQEVHVRNYAAVRLGDALRTVGDLAAADEAYAEAAEIGQAAHHAYGRLAGMVMHARVRAEQGRLREADEEFRRALRLLIEEGFELSPAAGIVYIGMADLRYERDDLDEAEHALERGMELAERTGDVSTLVWAYVTLSRNKRARGTRREHSKGPARRSASPAPP